METRMENYRLTHMDQKIEELLQFPIHLADQVRKAGEEADSFKQDCADLNRKVEALALLLRQAARFSNTNSAGLYERPTRRIMLDVEKSLEKAYGLVKKCKRSGILKRVITITNATDFKKVSLLLESSIGDVKWLLNVSASGEDRPEYSGLPPIASTDPVLALVWEQVSIVHVGTPDEKADGAVYLGNLAKDNDRNVKIIVEEGGVLPLLRLLKEGTTAGQENAARALGHLARDQQQVMAMRSDGAINVLVHVLMHGSMKVQVQVAWALSRFAAQDEEAQVDIAQAGGIRQLVGLLAHDTIEDVKLNKAISIHTLVKTTMDQQKTGVGGNRGGQPCDGDPGIPEAKSGNYGDPALDSVSRKPNSALTVMKNSYDTRVSPENGRQLHSLRQGSRNHRDREDPETKANLKAEAARALWKLAERNIKNSKLITDTRALLCFAKLIETGEGDVQMNSVLAVMEIAAAAENDPELRRAAFKTNSPAAKAVVEQLLRVIREEEPELQVPCTKAIGSLARIFPAPATRVIVPLTTVLGQSRDFSVAAEAAVALCKFAQDENYLHLEHSKTILDAMGAVHLVQLVNLGDSYAQLPALKLLCQLSRNVPDSDALAKAMTLPALECVSRTVSLTQNPSLRNLLNDAIAKLELYQTGGHVHGRGMPNYVP